MHGVCKGEHGAGYEKNPLWKRLIRTQTMSVWSFHLLSKIAYGAIAETATI